MKYYIRHPKTTQERSENGKRCSNGILEYEGHVVRIRAKRSKTALPDSYDDLWVAIQRSWKKQRNKQYKIKEYHCE